MDSLKLLLFRHIRGVWRHRWVSLMAAWMICVAGWAVIWFMPDQYQSNARLYVDADAVLTPLLRGLAADSAPGGQLELLQRTLLSRPNLETLISKTDLDLTVRGQSDRERLIGELGRVIQISPQTRTLFTISYTSSNPRLAYDVVQTLLTIFVERATGANRSDMENARRFLESQIASYERQLRSAEQRRAEFRTRYSEILPTAAGGGPGGLQGMRSQVNAMQGDLQDATRLRDSLKAELEQTPPLLTIETAAGPNGKPGAVSSPALDAAQQRLAELRLRYTDEHPEIRQQQLLIEEMRRNPLLARGPSVQIINGQAVQTQANGRNLSAPNPTYDKIKERLLNAEAQVNMLTRKTEEAVKERDRLEAIARAFPTVEAEYTALDRDYTVMQTNYQGLLARREQANIAQAADTQADKVKLQIVDPPQVPRIPTAPNRLALFSGVLIVGLGAGGGLAFLLTQFDRSFYTVDELREIGLTVIGGITLLGTAPRRRSAFATLGFLVCVALLGAIYAGLMARALRSAALV
jgi:polysaccharide chain length determinant protein (PEP-CTERM system associated)